jgi:cytochrome c oxidase subunit II
MCNRTLLKSLILAISLTTLAAAQETPVPAQAVAEVAPSAHNVAIGRSPSTPQWYEIYPDTQSVFARFVDNVNNFINIVSLLCFLVIIVFMVYFAVKFRRRDPHQKALSQKSHNTALELGWTIPPVIIVFVMFYYGFIGFLELNTPPDNAYTVYVTASKWNWSFKHPNGRIDAKEELQIDGQRVEVPALLHVPAGEPVVLRMESSDVLHSLYVPAFRVKKDVVPGRYTYLWFEAIDPTPDYYDPHADKEADEAQRHRGLIDAARGAHMLFCTEFCGTDHSRMLARVVVHPKGWRPADEPMPTEPVAMGRYLFTKVYGCFSCHAVSPGPALAGPSFAGGIFGRQSVIEGIGPFTVTDEYVRESITAPRAKIVHGFAPLMPDTFATMPEEHITAIIAYLRSLGEIEAR